MFLGSYLTRFTGKNRVILPVKFRDELKGGKEIILTRGTDQCIWGFAQSEWQKQAEMQLEIPINDPEGLRVRRQIFAFAQIALLDSQGRFVINKDLLDFAQILKEVRIIGAGDHFEIWNPDSWEKVIKK